VNVLRFYWSWFRLAHTYRQLDKELERLERLALLLAWTEGQPSLGDQAEEWLASRTEDDA